MSKSELLFAAIREKNSQIVKDLLNEDPELANTNEANVIFPLHTAVIEGNKEIVELLLDYNADIEAIYKDRNATPLDCAVVYGRKESISVLISRGANLDGKLQSALKGAAGEYEEYEELPTREEYGEIVKLLRERVAYKEEEA